MKKQFFLLASALGLLACSGIDDSSVESVVKSGAEEGVVTAAAGDFVTVSALAAKTHIDGFRHTVVGVWDFSDSSAVDDSASVPVDTVFKGENFAVDADVIVKDDSLYTIASAGLDGNGSSWKIQVENKEVIFSWRVGSDEDWQVFKTGPCLEEEGINSIRVERAGNLTVVSVNGEIKGAFKVKGRFDSVKGTFTIGYDKGDAEDCHCDNGHVEQIGVEAVDSLEEVIDVEIPEEIIEEYTAKDSVVENGDSAEAVNEVEWIAKWEFNNADNVGLDATDNGHNAKIGEGSVHSVDGIAKFDGKSGFVVNLTNDLKINEFVVEARVKPASFSRMQNIIVAEPPGRGVDGWQVRIDEGSMTFHIRDDARDGDNWNIYYGKDLVLNEWTVIRVERSSDSVKVFQDGEMTVAVAYNGDVTQMRYNWGIGFDAMDQGYHDRYFNGEMDYIRFGNFSGFSAGYVKNPRRIPLAAWEFNEPTFIGLDKMANNSTHSVFGAVIADTTVILDGKGGLQIPLSKLFKRNEFTIEARVKPTAFAAMQNIVVAEPPGRYGDGWIIRADDGVLTVHFRDEDTDGIEWNVLKGEKLALNEWNEIRVERTADSVKVFQNGNLTAVAVSVGDVAQISYNISIGYDAMKQTCHDRYFVGEMDYVRFYEK